MMLGPFRPHLVRDHVDKVFLTLLQMLSIRSSLQQKTLSRLSLCAGSKSLQTLSFRLDRSQASTESVPHRLDIFDW
jgi:hypothetical protein